MHASHGLCTAVTPWKLNHFYTKCLWIISSIKWQDMVPNTEAPTRAGIPSIHTFVQKAQVRWAGLVTLVAACQNNSCKVSSDGEQKKRFKDTIKNTLTRFNIDVANWAACAQDRPVAQYGGYDFTEPRLMLFLACATFSQCLSLVLISRCRLLSSDWLLLVFVWCTRRLHNSVTIKTSPILLPDMFSEVYRCSMLVACRDWVAYVSLEQWGQRAWWLSSVSPLGKQDQSAAKEKVTTHIHQIRQLLSNYAEVGSYHVKCHWSADKKLNSGVTMLCAGCSNFEHCN